MYKLKKDGIYQRVKLKWNIYKQTLNINYRSESFEESIKPKEIMQEQITSIFLSVDDYQTLPREVFDCFEKNGINFQKYQYSNSKAVIVDFLGLHLKDKNCLNLDLDHLDKIFDKRILDIY